VVFVIFVVKDPAMLRWVLIAALALAHAPAHADDTLHTCGNPAVILIVVDTLRADHLGTYGSARFTSPELDAQARRGAVFEHAYAPSPWTLPTVASLFTGLLGSQHGAGTLLTVDNKVLFAKLSDTPTTLGEHLHAFGYPTHAVAGNPNLHPRFGVARGFDRYDYLAGGMDHIRRADVIVDTAVAWMNARRGAPFFLFIHFFDPHMNYDPAPPTRGRFTGQLPSGRLQLPFAESARVRAGRLWLSNDEQEFVRAAYDEEIAFVDLQLGRLFDALRTSGWSDRAIVIFTADHGEEFWDHNGFEHGHTMYDELLRVPLIVWGPGVRPARIATPVSLVDVAATIADGVGAPPMPQSAGISLWPLLTSGAPLPARPLFADHSRYGPDRAAVVRWPHKVVVDLDSGARQLYDLERDPGERVNLAAKDPSTTNELAAAIAERMEARHAHARPEAATLDSATRERLQQLGYLE
jgi:arylsulfatase A-like enzyme